MAGKSWNTIKKGFQKTKKFFSPKQTNIAENIVPAGTNIPEPQLNKRQLKDLDNYISLLDHGTTEGNYRIYLGNRPNPATPRQMEMLQDIVDQYGKESFTQESNNLKLAPSNPYWLKKDFDLLTGIEPVPDDIIIPSEKPILNTNKPSPNRKTIENGGTSTGNNITQEQQNFPTVQQNIPSGTRQTIDNVLPSDDGVGFVIMDDGGINFQLDGKPKSGPIVVAGDGQGINRDGPTFTRYQKPKPGPLVPKGETQLGFNLKPEDVIDVEYSDVTPQKGIVPVGKEQKAAENLVGETNGSNGRNWVRYAVGAATGGGLVFALSDSRGQQTNAQLYGQQPLY